MSRHDDLLAEVALYIGSDEARAEVYLPDVTTDLCNDLRKMYSDSDAEIERLRQEKHTLSLTVDRIVEVATKYEARLVVLEARRVGAWNHATNMEKAYQHAEALAVRAVTAGESALACYDKLALVAREALDQIEGIGIEDWHGAEGLDLTALRTLVTEEPA